MQIQSFRSAHMMLFRLLLGLLCLLVWLGPGQVHAAPAPAREASATVTIVYRPSGVEAVNMIWGVNGWQALPEADLPAGTWLENGVMHTPMTATPDGFTTTLPLPPGAVIDYGFLITELSSGAYAGLWDGGNGAYQFTVEAPGEVVVPGTFQAMPSARAWGMVALWFSIMVSALGCGIWLIAAHPWFTAERAWRWALLGLFGLALVVRVLAAWRYNQGVPDTTARLTGDEPGYDALARDLLQGVFFSWPGRMPLYPIFIALSYALFGASYATLIYVQAFVGAALVPATYVLAREFVDRRGALIAALIAATHPALILQVPRLYAEVLYTPLFVLALWALVRAIRLQRMAAFAGAGLLMALVTLCRPVTLVFPAVAFVIFPWAWGLRQRVSATVVYGAALVALLLPWAWHNYRTFGEPMLTTISTYTTWQASPEYYRLFMVEGLDALTIFDRYVNAANNGGYNPFSIEGAAYFSERGMASIQAEPVVYLWYALLKAGYLWFGHPANYWEWPLNLEWLFFYNSPLHIAGRVFSLLLPPLTLIAFLVTRQSVRRYWPLIVTLLFFTAIHAALISEVRYSEPLYPLVGIIVAGIATSVVPKRLLANDPDAEPLLTAPRQPAPAAAPASVNLSLNRPSPGYAFDAVTALIGRELRIRYKGSWFGLLWAVLSPLGMVVVMHIVFTQLVPLGIPNYAAFIFAGLLSWTWFQTAVITGSSTLLDNRDLVRKPFFPRALLPLTVTGTNFVLYLLALPVLIAILLFEGVALTPALLALPAVWVVQFLFTLACTVLFAALSTIVRDVQHLLGVLMILWFYLTPIFYDLQRIESDQARFLYYNPLAVLVTAHRAIALEGRLPDWAALAWCAIISAGLLGLALMVFRSLEDAFVEEV